MTAEAEIRRRLGRRGRITFAEFMELALYHPGGGYYAGGAAGGPVGAAGDYYTSPIVHPAFGALLAVQLFQMWLLLGRPAVFTVAESGAGNGRLARDIRQFAAELPEGFSRCLRYICIDRGAVPQSGPAASGRGRPAQIRAAGVPLRGIVGCLLSNELLDAFPVHQVTLERGRLREVYVTLSGGALSLETGAPSTPALQQRLDALGVALAEGQTAEINLGLDSWATDAAAALQRGFVLAIDYGRRPPGLYSAAERRRGTLTTYYRHTQTDRPLERIGRQDISAQVDFTAAMQAAGRAGLDCLGYATQRDFLRNLGLEEWLRRPPQAARRREAEANRRAMNELLHPGGLGDFKALALGRGVGRPSLWGFQPDAESAALGARLNPPVLARGHIDLAPGLFPPTYFEIEQDALWPDSGLVDGA